MKRGEIFYADLDPTRGSEVSKCRPVLIVSNNANNRAASTVTVLPITSNVARVFPFEVRLPVGAGGLAKESKIQAQQIRTIAKDRFSGAALGSLDPATMQAVDEAIKLHLALP